MYHVNATFNISDELEHFFETLPMDDQELFITEFRGLLIDGIINMLETAPDFLEDLPRLKSFFSDAVPMLKILMEHANAMRRDTVSTTVAMLYLTKAPLCVLFTNPKLEYMGKEEKCAALVVVSIDNIEDEDVEVSLEFFVGTPELVAESIADVGVIPLVIEMNHEA